MQNDPYATLGVKTTATQAEIQAAYKRKARELHPDVNQADDAQERFRELVDAYELLRDEEKRAATMLLARPEGRFLGRIPAVDDEPRNRADAIPSPTSDSKTFGSVKMTCAILSMIFCASGPAAGPRQPGLSEAPAVEARRSGRSHLSIPLEHAYSGTTLDMSVDIPDEAGIKKTHTFRLKIPQGAKNGDRLKLKDPEVTVVLRLETGAEIEVEGRDVRTSVEIAPWEAALGGEIDVPSPKGPLRLKIPVGTSSGQRLRLRGQGIPQKPGRDGEPGDFYVKVKIVVPPILTEEEREAFEHLRRSVPSIHASLSSGPTTPAGTIVST